MAFKARQARVRPFLFRWPAMLLLCAFSVAGTAGAEETANVPFAVFAQQLTAADTLAHNCARDAAACSATDLPGQERITGSSRGDFAVRWDWLREAITSAKMSKVPDRQAAMAAASSHLRELARESGTASAADDIPSPEFGRARASAKAALSRDEFRASEGPTWLQRKLARFQDWLLKLFSGVDKLGRKAPWLAPLIEWGCFGLAIAGLLFFVFRNLQRQALRISLTEGAALHGTGGRETADWERQASEQAARGAWREAVHSLYWGGIALLEGRRAWRPNTARTPREYLRYLQPGSEAQNALRRLTRDLESVWYGFQEAGEPQYLAARNSLEALRAAKTERVGGSEDRPSEAATAFAGGL